MKTLKITVAIYIIAMLLTACGASGASDQSASLDGTSWVLTAFNKNQPMAGREPTISFEDGQASGTTGCNSYGGGYQLNGDKISFDAMFMTEMFCEDVADQESIYLQLLGQAERYEVVDGVLTIFCGPQQTLTFVPAE